MIDTYCDLSIDVALDQLISDLLVIINPFIQNKSLLNKMRTNEQFLCTSD